MKKCIEFDLIARGSQIEHHLPLHDFPIFLARVGNVRNKEDRRGYVRRHAINRIYPKIETPE